MEILGMEIDVAKIVGILIQIGILIIAFLIVVPIGKKIIEKTLQRAAQSRKASPGRMKTLEKLLANVFSYIMIFIFIVMFFATLGVEIGPLIAGAGVIGLAVAFGAQGLVSDIVTGFFILLEQQLEIDDYVTTAGYDGIVEEIGLRTTKIRSFDGTLNYVPNRYIEGVANHSRGNMRALVDIGISYDDNIDGAITVLEKVCAEFQLDERFKDGPNAIGVQSIGSSDIVLRVVGQTENGLQWACERDMRKRIKEAFDEANIDIPFPHHVLIQKDN
ncbi:mechanosensitive ion channel protein [Virgibacillus halodenitrificans]|uniref:Mechanosensitive ion channel protein n=1 Tax=Virgibacillus halodenitrificans TaxID=1482 RepID=A0AAC9IXT4_VIRHA|nr:mechanosensitive ion channel family protein [Virgibacillus halodenitrificans]APC47142.1 mechanosensitive ion channel protein [Virgibacillus halodenitrificans]